MQYIRLSLRRLVMQIKEFLQKSGVTWFCVSIALLVLVVILSVKTFSRSGQIGPRGNINGQGMMQNIDESSMNNADISQNN
jgi:hypothetical protein